MYKKSVVLVIIGLMVVSTIAAGFVLAGSKKRPDLADKPQIAIIYVDGMIVGGRGQSTLLSESGGTDSLIKELHAARDDAAVKAVVLRINSPGGSAPASQEVGEELLKLRQTGKVVVTSMADMAASGGYWLAACTDKIYANSATLTGSIGVYMPYANWEELYKKIGISQEKIKSGPHKDIMSPDRPMTEEERAIIQAMVDDMYNQFVEVVATGRNMDEARVRQLADGRIYTGRQAKELGLVDELGNMYDAIEGAAALAGISGKPQIKEYGKQSPWSMLLGGSSMAGLEEVLFQRVQQQRAPLMAPLAVPANWQVE